MEKINNKKAREVLQRVHTFLGILIREQLIKDAPFLEEGELEDESSLADDVWEVLNSPPRQCDVGTAEEQENRFREFCEKHRVFCGDCELYAGRKGGCRFHWAQMPYKEGVKDEL